MAHTKKMLTKDWISVTPCPIQRDTLRHATKAKHLHTPHPTHSVVHAAELPDNRLIKLDGHTRALLWERKEIEVPLQVTVVIYDAANMEAVERLYKDFDSKDALETTRDKVSGAYNKHNFDPQSALLQYGHIVQGLRLAYGVLLGGTVKTSAAGGPAARGAKGKDRRSDKQVKTQTADIYVMLDEFSYELHALDGFGLRQGQITNGIIGAFLLSYRKYGHKVTPFWQGVFANTGSKIGGQMDAIQALSELMLATRGYNNKMKTADIAARALQAVEKYLRDEMLYRIPSPLDSAGYLENHKKPTERLIKSKDIKKKAA